MGQFFKNINFSEVFKLKDLTEYSEGKVVSLTLVQREDLSITSFAFEKGEGLSTHSAPGDAMICVTEGKALIKIGEDEAKTVSEGEIILMPANIPHSVDAVERFKMLLIVVKEGRE